MTLDEITADIKVEFPMARIVTKETPFWRFLGTVVKIITLGKNSAFCTRYTTTLGPIIAFPPGAAMTDHEKARTLEHERIHLRQTRRCGLGNFWLGIPIFMIAYLFLPLPFGLAYCRYVFEREAYVESLHASFRDGVSRDTLLQVYVPRYVEQLVGGSYMWTWPFRKSVESFMNEGVDKITASQ